MQYQYVTLGRASISLCRAGADGWRGGLQGRLVRLGVRQIGGQFPGQSMKARVLLRRDDYVEQTSRRPARGHEHRPGRGSSFAGIFCVEWGRDGRFGGGIFPEGSAEVAPTKKGSHDLSRNSLFFLARLERFELTTYGFVVRKSADLLRLIQIYRFSLFHSKTIRCR